MDKPEDHRWKKSFVTSLCQERPASFTAVEAEHIANCMVGSTGLLHPRQAVSHFLALLRLAGGSRGA